MENDFCCRFSFTEENEERRPKDAALMSGLANRAELLRCVCGCVNSVYFFNRPCSAFHQATRLLRMRMTSIE